ncbi:MAG TPA: type II toxin-antitoxin system death-on-curing family toxin [Candidatus Saccharimonadales bacterium]|nr:type II toxin-antitoxin system death-on-curing family toxin [Candidatus Saccharimonadales bacterium]
MTLFTLEQLLEIHALVVEITDGSAGLRDLGRLESVIATQTQNVFGEELYLSIVDKSAAIIRGIIADHPFVDGNKRTAMLSGLTLLEVNGVSFIAKTRELEDFAVEVATQHLDVPQISSWLQHHTKQV